MGECGCCFGCMSGILGSIPNKNKREQKVLVPSLRRVDHEFKTSLGYSREHCLKKKSQGKKEWETEKEIRGRERRRKRREKCKYRHHIGELSKTLNYFTLTQISMNYKGIFVVDTVVYSSGKYEKLTGTLRSRRKI